jgi:DNA polymerase-4
MEKEIGDALTLWGTVGLAGNKLVSRIASEIIKRPGVCEILRGSEKTFIGPLPVGVLPGVGSARQTILQELNLRRVEQVAALSIAQLRLAFGPFAPLLHQRARGVDPSPVSPPRRSPEVSEETFLPQAENDDAILLAELARLVELCGFRLRRQGQGACRLALAIHFADGMVERRTFIFATGENRDAPLLEAAEEMFRGACRRRVQVKGMNLVCSRLGMENRQMDLFVGSALGDEHRGHLQEAVDQLRERYGMEVVQRGKLLAQRR